MQDGHRPGRLPRPLVGQGELPPTDDDFLFHLSRGSELLVQNRVVEAKEELERAISVRPQDAQGQDLLAGVYFRLGVYPTAIALWRRLVEQIPDEVTLRVNLGLALLKTGQPNEAQVHLEHALTLDAEHERAWSYLGLVHWRAGRLEEARAAFMQGGQASMARRMEEEAAHHASSRPPEPRREAESEADDRMVTALRDAASEALGRLTAPELPLAVAGEREPTRKPSGQWRVVESGHEALGRAPRARPMPAAAPPTLEALLDAWTIALPDGVPLSVDLEGRLLIESEGAVHCRRHGLALASGSAAFEAVHRRFPGRASEEVLGGEVDPIVRWSGPVAAVLAAPEGLRYHALRMEETLLYVRESAVQAFDDRLTHESGRLPIPGASEVVCFQGRGSLVLRLRARPAGVLVRDDREVIVESDALLGWSGRLFPRAIEDEDRIAFRGRGTVLVA